MRRMELNRATRGLSSCDKCQKSMLVFDAYRRPILMRLPDGSQRYRTTAGSYLTILTIFTLLAAGGLKLSKLITY